MTHRIIQTQRTHFTRLERRCLIATATLRVLLADLDAQEHALSSVRS